MPLTQEQIATLEGIVTRSSHQSPMWWATLLAILGLVAIVWYLRKNGLQMDALNQALRDSNAETRRSNDRTIELLTGVIQENSTWVKAVDVRLAQVETQLGDVAKSVARCSVGNRP